MKSLLLIFLLACNSVVSAASGAKGVSVLELKGRPLIEKRKDESSIFSKTQLRKKELIRGSGSIHTDAKSEILLQLEPGIELKVYPDTEVTFPLIRWEDGRSDEFILKHGKVRWQSQGKSQIMLKSDLFESTLPEGIFVVIYEPAAPRVQLLALKGEAEFQEKNGEESVKVSAGKKVEFLGHREDGEIAYDVLLQGRKIPKGKKSAIEDLSKEDKQLFSIEAEKKSLEASKKKSKTNEGKNSARKNEICKRPGGTFNECRWVCENNPKDQRRCRLDLSKVRCVRSRCNANGEWAESYELTPAAGTSICKPYPVVQACDY